MPFTLSHAAAVLPAIRLGCKRVFAAALIIGSMTPDVEYFMRGRVVSTISHTWVGLVVFDIPVGLAMLIAFVTVVRPALLVVMPSAARQRLAQPFESCTLRLRPVDWLGVVASLGLGALTHFAWDAFTHQTGSAVRVIPLLTTDIRFSGVTLPVYHALQHVSTVVGLATLAWFVWRMPRKPVVAAAPWASWLVLVSVAGGAAVVVCVTYDGLIGDVVAAAIAGACVGLLGSGVVLWAREPRATQLVKRGARR